MQPAPDPDEFVRVMTPAVRRAAELARSLEGRVRNVPKRTEATAVKQALTEADTAAQDVLLETLEANWPEVALAAEEDTPAAARFRKQGDVLVIIDPIDGTLHSYLEAAGPYAVILGLAVAGSLRAGIVGLPREGLVSHQMPAAVVEALRERGLVVVPSCGGAIAVAPLVPGVCAGLRWSEHPQGVSVRGRVGTLIAREAGACVAGDGGRPLSLDLGEVVATLRLATSESDLALLGECLRAAGID